MANMTTEEACHGEDRRRRRAVLAGTAAMSGSDRTIGHRLHAVIRAAAPDLSPKTWYGLPAYAKDGEVVCFFRSAEKF
jgi:hypothetical protein